MHQFHYEIGLALGRGTGIEHAGNVDVIHDRQCLPFHFEPRDNLAAIHAGLNDLEGDFALHGLALLSHPHDSHAAFTDLLQQFVRADLHRRLLGETWMQRFICRGG